MLFTMANKASNSGLLCAVRGCYCSEEEAVFFRFPIDPARSTLWLLACNRQDLRDKSPLYLYNHFRLCSNHFEARMFLNTRQLLPSALPTIFRQFEGSSTGCNKSIKKRKLRMEAPSPKKILLSSITS